MKSNTLSKGLVGFWGLVFILAPIQMCFSIPILRFKNVSQVSTEQIHAHLWVLEDPDESYKLSEVQVKESSFQAYNVVKDSLASDKTYWGLLRLHNDSPSPISWVLAESNETRLQVFIGEGNRLVYAGQSGQLVKHSEEQLPDGNSWEARIHLNLLPGQYKQVYIRSHHDFDMTDHFDFKLSDYEEYQNKVKQRNLYQAFFQGALGMLLIYHFLLFFVNRRKAYLYFSLYVFLAAIYYQYFFGLSKEWFWGEMPWVDLGYAAIPIMIPNVLILTSFYFLDKYDKRSKKWKKIKWFNVLSLLCFVICLSLLYSQVATKYGFRLVNIFILINPFFVFYFFKSVYRKVQPGQQLYLLGTFLLSVLSSLSSILFIFDELLAGILVQSAILLQVMLFAIGLGFRQVQVGIEKEKSQGALLQQLQLKQAFEKDLKAHFEEKVRKRTAALEDQKNALLIAKQQADKANKLKTDLLSMVQHDIRTPIHAILGMSNLLQEEKSLDDQSQMLNTLNIASANLLGLVNNILDYSQIEAANIKLEQGPVNLNHLADQLLDGVLPLCKQKNLALILNFDADIPYELFGPGIRLKQILANLLHNAAKFTETGSITFGIKLKTKTPHQALIHFSVSDSGPGIPLADQKYIFEGLKRNKKVKQKVNQGRGLGLAIVNKLLILLGTQIQLQSQIDQGSSFSFDLWLGLSSDKKHKKTATLENQAILLVEDNQINQAVATRFLNQWGMQVTMAQNGVEALQILDTQSFDLILMDLQMPIMDGYEAASIISLHEKEEIRNIPIIALSAVSDHNSRKKAKAAGIERFIAKPFNPKDLKLKIEEILVE